MIKKFATLVFIFTSFSSFSQTPKEMVYNMTKGIIKNFENNQYDSISKLFDSTMLRQLSGSRLGEVWENLPNQFGKFDSFGKTNIDTVPGFYISQTLLQYKKLKLSMSISFNSEYQIAGFYFYPKYTYSPPEYINTLSFTEYKVTFGKAPYIVNGTLTVPNKINSPPCAIIVGGSGPTDRDGSVGDNKTYKDIAWALACKGIAVLRFDKRTFSYGSQLLSDKYAGKKITIKDEYLDDVKEAIDYLRHNSKVDSKKIVIIGHSQGGMLAPLICEQNKKVAGVILMAGNARPMQDLLIEQLDFLYKDMDLPSGDRIKINLLKRNALNAKSKNLTTNYPEDSLPGAPAEYWISINEYNQVETAKKLKQPILILQGERDYQVTMIDFSIWKQALQDKKNSTFKSYPKLNHLFLEGEGKSNKEEYEKRGSVPEYVIKDIADWMNNFQKK
jgi:uncharacterized protein